MMANSGIQSPQKSSGRGMNESNYKIKSAYNRQNITPYMDKNNLNRQKKILEMIQEDSDPKDMAQQQSEEKVNFSKKRKKIMKINESKFSEFDELFQPECIDEHIYYANSP